jgi:uncharacterized phage protein (TIGR02220 family)
LAKGRTASRSQESEPEQLRLFGDAGQDGRRAGEEISLDDEVVQAALDHLNKVTERTGPARFTSAKSIKARIGDGATLGDLLLVIDFCHALWWGEAKMETYIRPKTLFGPENFPEYLVRARKWQAEGRPSLVGARGQSLSPDFGRTRGVDYYRKMREGRDS